MSEHSEMPPEVGMEWEREVRGYNRQQVDNYVAWRAGQVRELENRLSQSLGEIEHLRAELAAAHDSAARPAHEEISERVGQILKLAADEAKADREKGAADANDLREAAHRETDKLRADVKAETDRIKTEAQERAERMLTAAQDQADRAVATARAEADEMVSSAHAAAEQTIAEANSHAETTVSTALAQAKQQLDEATARATAIHDGAERRLNLLISRHTETVRRLTEIRDVVTGLVAGETSRGSLEDEVNRALGLPANGAAQHGHAQSGPQRNQRQASVPDAMRQTALPGPPEDQDEHDPEAAPVATAAAVPVATAPAAPSPAAPGPAVPAGPASRQAADDDPLTGPPPEQAAYANRETRKHATDAALRAAEEIRQANARRRGTQDPAAELVLGETAAGGRGVDI